MDTKDQGHRYGNFPNYYTFNPPTNRLSVLEDTNILSYIRHGLRNTLSCDGKKVISSSSGGSNEEVSEEERATKKLRLETKLQRQLPDCIYYCDLGCNEGDLTIAMASSLHKKYTSNEHDSSEDESLVDNVSSYSKVVVSSSVKVLGLDLDPMLIDRANNKIASSSEFSAVDNKSKKVEEVSNCGIDATFKVCNLCSESKHNNAYTSYINDQNLQLNDTSTSTTEASKNSEQSTANTSTQLFHLTTIFSTTMWIHIHSGDIGLQSFIERACLCTKRYLLIEPQPSGCYRKANTRLRKMGRQELDDVTPTRLKMRLDIESAIEQIVIGCGFRRVSLDEISGTKTSTNDDDKTTDDGKKKDAATTAWNRSLQLYERQA